MALTDNIVAYWKLDETTGNSADSVGSNILTNNGTLGYVSAKINNGGDLGSGNSTKYFSRTDSCGIGSDNSSVYTFNIWLKLYTNPSSGDSNKYSIFGVIGSGQKQTNRYYRNDSGTYKIIYVQYNGSTAEVIEFTLSGALSTSVYTMITLIKNGTALSVKINNGTAITGTTTQADGNPSRGPLFKIGRSVYDNDAYLPAIIDEIGVWSVVGIDTTSLYNSGNGIQYPFSTSSIKSINGLAKSSIKNVNGLAIASVKSFNGLA